MGSGKGNNSGSLEDPADAGKPARHAEGLIAMFESRRATVGVVGLGYVGLPILGAMHDAGYATIGFDIDAEKIAKLKRGESYLRHPDPGLVGRLSGSDRFTPTTDEGALAGADAVLLCVPTPLGPGRIPDLRYVERSTEMVARVLRAGQLIVLESTTYPGTTREVCLPILEREASVRGLRLGWDYLLAYSPEREDPGRTSHTTRTVPRLVAGIDARSLRAASALYRGAIDTVIEVGSCEVAESAKLLENIYRAVNIALINELAEVFAAMGIDATQVVRAASSKPYGFQAFHPGPGLGGHCIPIDPFYLSWKARQIGEPTHFIELAGEVNQRRPRVVVDRVVRALNDDAKPVRGSRVLVLGLAYKKNVDDVRETPAAEIIAELIAMGADVEYHDPHVSRFPRMRRHHYPLASVALSADRLAASDCVVVVTDHDAIDWALVAESSILVVDTRDALGGIVSPRARIVRV